MRHSTSARYLLVCALIHCAQIMQIFGGGNANPMKSYEIVSIDKYDSLAKDRQFSLGKVVVKCDFDIDWCGFRNEKHRDDFDWTKTSRKTPSSGTGPKHDLSGKGSFIFIETSSPRRINDTARLVSQIIPPMIYCLRFGFHAKGETLGSLVVSKRNRDGKQEGLLVIDRQYGNSWQFVTTTVLHYSRFKLVFEGIRGKSYRGDIGLDNITLTEGSCENQIRQNNTDECGVGHPGFGEDASPEHTWPWVVWLSHNSELQPSCPGVQVGGHWTLTTRECERIYNGYKVNKSKRRRFAETLQTAVLLKLNTSTSTRMQESICLPATIPLQNRVTKCYLLGIPTIGYGKHFVEFPAIVLSTRKCRRKTTSGTSHDLTRMLCVQINRSSGFNDSQPHHGYVVCKNKIINRWVLQAIGPFSKSDLIENVVVLERVSSYVDWIQNTTTPFIRSPIVNTTRRDIPAPPKAPLTEGFQIMDKASQECLTLLQDNQRLTYKPCSDLNIAQRFRWTREYQLVAVHANFCVESVGTRSHFLRVFPCLSTVVRRRQKWVCKGDYLYNAYFRRYISSKSSEHSGLVHLSQAHEEIAHLMIAGTKDNLCTLRPVVNGVFQCDFNRHRMCGFEGTDTAAQFRWRASRRGSSDFKQFPGLTSTDRYFTVVRRTNVGTPTAALRSPSFSGQHCVRFLSFMHGSAFSQLNVLVDGGGKRKRIFQTNVKSDRFWRPYSVTIAPEACEVFQIVFEAALSEYRNSKVAIREIVISPGACRSGPKSAGVCPNGWKFIDGHCWYFHNTKLTWHDASAVCDIVDAKLATPSATNEILPRATLSWFGARSCPTGRIHSVKGVSYNNTFLYTTPVCLMFHNPRNGAELYQNGPCDLKLPFACQKDPIRITGVTCGWRNTSAVSDRQWPWHVMIVNRNRCVCGGTLIAPGFVVTSFLCLSRVWLQKVQLFLPSSRKLIRKVTKIINHPLSGIKSGDNDISIVIFEDDGFLLGPSVNFACVNRITNGRSTDGDYSFLKERKCVVLGWGTFHQMDGNLCNSEKYKAREVEVVSRQECAEYYGQYMITERIICAKAKNETLWECLGDTGGPLVCEISGTWTLVGITSWGVGCTPTRKYGIYTDVAAMKPWIDVVSRENQ